MPHHNPTPTMKHLVSALALLALTSLSLAASFGISVAGGKTDQSNVVVRFPVPKDSDAAGVNAAELSSGTTIPAEVVKPGLTDAPAVKQYLVFVLPKLKAGETITATPKSLKYVVAPPHFQFEEKS